MTPLDTLLESVRHSPQLPEVVDALQQQLQEENQLRQKFYAEMTPEQKVEFINGEVVMHSPARSRHLDVTLQIATLLKTWVSRNRLGTIKVEKCLCVFPRNDYEPDIVFFGPEKSKLIEPDTMKFPIPDFVVEVLSKSTEDRDRGEKFEDYAAHGVTEYWIVSADAPFVEQYVLAGSDNFDLRLKALSGTIKSVAIPDFTADIEAFFDEEKNLTAQREMLAE